MTHAFTFTRTAADLIAFSIEIRAVLRVFMGVVFRVLDAGALPRDMKLLTRKILADAVRAMHGLIHSLALRRIGWVRTRARRCVRPLSVRRGFRRVHARGNARRQFRRTLPRPRGSIIDRLAVLKDLYDNLDAHVARVAAHIVKRVTRSRVVVAFVFGQPCVGVARSAVALHDSS